jgi:stage II sporulation protein AA (anti-sigma F factor antagonist)
MPDLVCHLIPVQANPSLAVVSLRGSIDPRNLSGLAAALQSVAGRGVRTLIFDLGEIRYINSAGLAYLVNLSDFLESRGGGLHLANAQPKVKLVFEMMGLTEFFTIHKSVGAVLALLGKERRPTSPTVPSRPSRRP